MALNLFKLVREEQQKYSLLFICLFIIFTTYCSQSYAQPSEYRALDSTWSYHLGDLPRDSTNGQWQPESGVWSETASPDSFPKRTDEHIVWLKTNLPKGSWRDPYLFISSIDLSVQVFIGQQQIYRFGDIDEDGNGQFAGWPWHAIELPRSYDQDFVYFRVYSDYPFIGLAGDILIGERFELLDRVYREGATGLSFVLVILLIGAISMIMGLIKHDRKAAISTGVLSFNLSLMMFSENELSQVLFYEPLMWRYIAAFSYFLIPALLAILISAWLKNNTLAVANGVRNISFLFTFSVAGLSLLTDFSFINAYPYFDVLFIVLVSGLVIAYLRDFIRLGVPGMLMATGIIGLFGSLVLDMLSAHGFITWIGHTGQWGLILFTLASFLIYLVQDWSQQIDLAELTHKLETKVLKRTEQLQASQEKLERLATEDYLTKLLNRRSFTELAKQEITLAKRSDKPLSLVLFDLDLFKRVNDQYGHKVGDLVLTSISKVVRNTCREGELICRFGGEEFVVLLPGTNATFARSLVERLRVAISEMEVANGDDTIKVTASFGLITLPEHTLPTQDPQQILERLLAEADKIMYEAKEAGRDEVRYFALGEAASNE